jgi:hypothetical protein
MSHQPMHIHAYTGREAGIMIIGTREELTEFASDLQRSLALEPKPPAPGWPSRLLSVNGVSPFVDKDYPISFHIRTEPIPETLQRRIRHAPSTPVFLGIAALAFVGLVSLPVWLAKAL